MNTKYSSEALYGCIRLVAVCVIAILCLPAMPSSAGAAFYKCVSADGSTTYNDAPCAANESTQRLNKNAREMTRLDCRIAHNFAFDAVARMRQDDTVLEVFQAYGGAENLSEGAQKLIKYVFSFESNWQASVQRIVELTTERCEAGLLGETLDQCESFPGDFIARLGNCVAARQTDQTILLQPSPDKASGSSAAGKSGATAENKPAPTPALNAARPEAGYTPDRESDYNVLPSERTSR